MLVFVVVVTPLRAQRHRLLEQRGTTRETREIHVSNGSMQQQQLAAGSEHLHSSSDFLFVLCAFALLIVLRISAPFVLHTSWIDVPWIRFLADAFTMPASPNSQVAKCSSLLVYACFHFDASDFTITPSLHLAHSIF